MLKGEIEILASIVLYKGTIKQLTTARIARHNSFIVTTLNTLMDKRYIVSNKARGYQITNKGIRALAEFYPEHSTLNKAIHTRLLSRQSSEASKAIKMIEQLKSDYNIKINYLRKFQGKNISN